MIGKPVSSGEINDLDVATDKGIHLPYIRLKVMILFEYRIKLKKAEPLIAETRLLPISGCWLRMVQKLQILQLIQGKGKAT